MVRETMPPEAELEVPAHHLRRIMDPRLRRAWGLSLAGLLLVALLGIVLLSGTKSPAVPRPKYVPGGVPLETQYDYVGYQFSSSNPFANGKMLVTAMNTRRETHVYRFDMQTGEVLGEVRSGGVVHDEADDALLLMTRETRTRPEEQPQAVQLMRSLLQDLRLVSKEPPRERLDFWAQPGEATSPVLIGSAHEWVGSGGWEHASPRGNYYRVFTSCDEHLVVDIGKARLLALPPARSGNGGWWSDNEVLFLAPNGDMALHNVETRMSGVLFSIGDIQSFLRSHGLALSPGSNHYSVLSAWHKDHFEFCLVDNFYGQKSSWLVKIDRSGPALRLLSTTFPFARLGRFNGAGTHYVHSGERETGDQSAVYLYDIATSKTLTLVPPTPGATAYSLPNFYGDRIVYVQDKTIRSTNLDGSGQRILFPPQKAESPAEAAGAPPHPAADVAEKAGARF